MKKKAVFVSFNNKDYGLFPVVELEPLDYAKKKKNCETEQTAVRSQINVFLEDYFALKREVESLKKEIAILKGEEYVGRD